MAAVSCPECTAVTVQEDLDINGGVCGECAYYDEELA